MRVYKNKYYICRRHPGISGFQQWDKYEYYVVTGHYAQNHKTEIYREFMPDLFAPWFRVTDGHLPDYQPRMSEYDALKWLNANPYQAAYFILDTEKYYLRN